MLESKTPLILTSPQNLASSPLIYPIFVKIFIVLLSALFLYLIPRFIMIDLPLYVEIHNNTQQAHNSFTNKDYEEAIILYEEILERYPGYRAVKVPLIKAYFALIPYYSECYQLGLKYLVDEEFSNTEIRELKELLPPDYQEPFQQLFEVK